MTRVASSFVPSLVLALVLSACTTVGPDFDRGPVAMQDRWSSGTAGDGPEAIDERRFWASFGDPELARLIDRALAGSPTIAQAAARVDEARAQLAVTRGGALPSAELGTSANYTNPDLPSRVRGTREGSTVAQLAVQASWEPDLWGSVRRAIEADAASLDANRAAWQGARTALAATVASTWLDLRTIALRLQVAHANLDAQSENARIAEARVRAGATSELDLRQALTQLRVTSSQLAPLEASMRVRMHALSVLVGETPDWYERTRAHDALGPYAPDLRPPAGLPLGMPHDLLRRRPDVVQAERVAASQSARIGQSEAALYPSLTLSGSFGTRSTNAGGNSIDLFSWGQRITTAGIGLTLPIFDRGRLRAQVDVQDARFRQALLDYQNQVLKAQQEVEDALANTAGSLAAESELQDARAHAQRGVALAIERYKAGDADFTTVTSAAQSQLQVEDSLVVAQGNALQGYVSAYRALGGGWSGDLADPVPSPSSHLSSR